MIYNLHMRVYRYLSEDELNNMKDGNVSDLGRDGGFIKIAQRKYKMKLNTHRYAIGEKYLHFFKKDLHLQVDCAILYQAFLPQVIPVGFNA